MDKQYRSVTFSPGAMQLLGHGQELFCKVTADHFDCYLDADGGKVRLTPEGDRLRLEVTDGDGGTDQIVVEGTDWGEFGTPAATIAFSSYGEPTATLRCGKRELS